MLFRSLNWIAHYFNNFIVNIPSIKVEGTVHSPKILDSAKITFFSTEWKRSEAGREFILNNPILGDIVRTDLGFGIILAIIFAIILFITHDLGVINEMADDVAVMYCGQVVEKAPVKVLFGKDSKYSHPYTDGLMFSVPRLDTPTGVRLEAIPGSY